MASERITVRERLAPEITASLFANYRSSADAILELADNSVDSRLPGKPLRIDLTLRTAFIQITTIGGHGMGPREVEAHYLRWGVSPKRSRELLGRYGQGGKAAIGHLGQGFTIDASRPGDEWSWQFSDTRYRDRSRLKVYELHRIPKRVDASLGYVRIRVEGVDRKVDVRRIVARLIETYRPLLEREAITINVNGGPLSPPPIPVAERHDFTVDVNGQALTGWYGVLAEDAPRPEPGLRCYRLGRLVAAGELFGHQGPAQSPGLVRLTGEVEIPNVPLTLNKTDFDRDSEEWMQVEERMHGLLADLVARLGDASAPPPAGAERVAEQVRKVLGQALRLAGAETPFTGFEPIVLRPLDPSTRSTMIEEDGARVIVINTRHPLFRQRRGDVWYQLETAAREVYAGLERSSVAEYERRVNEVLLLGMELGARRRPQRRRRAPQLNLL